MIACVCVLLCMMVASARHLRGSGAAAEVLNSKLSFRTCAEQTRSRVAGLVRCSCVIQ